MTEITLTENEREELKFRRDARIYIEEFEVFREELRKRSHAQGTYGAFAILFVGFQKWRKA